MANCSVLWNSFSGSPPDSLIQFFIFYCCAVCVFGLLCNGVALWCVVGCPRTRPAVKVLLCTLFSTTLFMCLLVMPFVVHFSISKLWCVAQVSMSVFQGFVFINTVLTEMELFYILVMAFLRTQAVWSPQRHQVKLRTSVALVAGVALCATLTTLSLMVPYWVDAIDKHTGIIASRAMSVLHFFLPMLLTLACYSSMIFAVRRNKHRLGATPDTAATAQVMDQATRAMLAVFISNLLLGLPHSIYHILPYDYSTFSYVMVHIVFYAHLFVDPLAFVCFNVHHRQRVLDTLKSWPRRIRCRPRPATLHATSTLPLHLTPAISEMSRKDPI